MAEPAFDTLAIAKELEHDYGFGSKQAEGAATMLHRHLVGHVATKDDLEVLDGKLTARIETQGRELSAKIEALDDRLTGKIEAQGRELSAKIEAQGRELSAKIEALEENMATKTEIAEVRTEIARSSNRTIYALGGLIGFLFIVDRFVPILSAGG